MTLAFDQRASEDSRSEYGPFRIEAHASGIALLWFDDPARKVNLLDSSSLAALRRVLEALKQRSDHIQYKQDVSILVSAFTRVRMPFLQRFEIGRAHV